MMRPFPADSLCLFPVVILSLGFVASRGISEVEKKNHGMVKMGVKRKVCDDGENGVGVDWDGKSTLEYTCNSEKIRTILAENIPSDPVEECLTESEKKKDEFKMMHSCLNTSTGDPNPISYNDKPPRSGHHRPLWPMYGEYKYCPPQRWLHSVEHGAAVFLYHPCAPGDQVAAFLDIGRSCLRRRVATPYLHLPIDTPFAVVTYQCRLMISNPTTSVDKIKDYIRTHALRGPETVSSDGQYDIGLTEHAEIVTGSDISDSNLQNVCPVPTNETPDAGSESSGQNIVYTNEYYGPQ